MGLFNIWVTRRCNLKCPYCYEGEKKSCEDFKKENISALIRFILHTSGKQSSIGVNFHGGEPLLRFDLIEDIICRLEGKINANYSFTTNGTLLSDDVIRKIAEHNIYVSLSMDGEKKTHDKYRVFADGSGSFEKVASNLEKLKKAGVPARIRMTVMPEDVDKLYENIYGVVKRGCKVIVAVPDFYSGNWNDKKLLGLEEQNKKIAELNKQLKQKDNEYDIVLFDNPVPQAKGTCTGGVNEFNIDTDGKIYPCTYAAGNEKYCIGKISGGVEQDKIRSLRKMYTETMEECEGCGFMRFCLAHRCRFLNEALTGKTNRAPELICGLEHMMFRQFISMQ